ncbi:MAG TPA: TetR family transcriptional regulator [Micromonosporaceae bacterium]|nr:TetR family transcriptional regulator [Micromonosporaceae bacterium]
MTLTPHATDTVRIGRPRSARAHEAIIDAILELISEGMSVDALSIEAVAARAGVGKATIYRRWPNKQAMLADAIKELKGPPPQPTGEGVRERLISLLSKVSTGDERAAKIFPCILPEIVRSESAYELWQAVIEPRREVMREVLRQGIADGELRADIDIEVVAATLTGPVLASRMMRWNPRLDNDALPEQVVDTVLAGIKSP